MVHPRQLKCLRMNRNVNFEYFLIKCENFLWNDIPGNPRFSTPTTNLQSISVSLSLVFFAHSHHNGNVIFIRIHCSHCLRLPLYFSTNINNVNACCITRWSVCWPRITLVHFVVLTQQPLLNVAPSVDSLDYLCKHAACMRVCSE